MVAIDFMTIGEAARRVRHLLAQLDPAFRARIGPMSIRDGFREISKRYCIFYRGDEPATTSLPRFIRCLERRLAERGP